VRRPLARRRGALVHAVRSVRASKGSLFVGALAGKHLARLTLEGPRVVGEERLLADQARIRDVKVGPDGALYILTDEDPGELLVPAP